MKRSENLPPIWSVALGFSLGPGVAAALFAVASPLYAGLPDLADRIVRTAVAVAWVVYPVAVTIGLPLYFVLRKRARPTALNCAVAGGFVAALPWLLLSIITPDEASTGDVVTVHNHLRTTAGWLELLQFVGGISILGAVAGLVFWCAVSLGRLATAKSAKGRLLPRASVRKVAVCS